MIVSETCIEKKTIKKQITPELKILDENSFILLIDKEYYEDVEKLTKKSFIKDFLLISQSFFYNVKINDKITAKVDPSFQGIECNVTFDRSISNISLSELNITVHIFIPEALGRYCQIDERYD